MSDDQSNTSFGLFPSSGFSAESTDWAGIISPTDSVGVGPTPPAPNPGNTQASTIAATANLVPATTLSQLNGLIGGGAIVPTSSGYMDSYTAATGPAPFINFFGNSNIRTRVNPTSTTFTGSDLKLLIDCTPVGKPNQFQQLIECHTISVTSYRMKSTVRALGYTNPKGFARANRTIAGTMILTEMGIDALATFLQSVTVTDKSKDSQVTKSDQLPPFNITMVFANEEGYASARTILGVEFLNDGTVYSVQDLLTERTISWMAYDFTPLLPLDTSQIYLQHIQNITGGGERTPMDLMASPPINNLIPLVS
jgi:hypothetical protein